MRILTYFNLFISFSLLAISAYVLWNLDVMINEQLELIELESMLGSVDPVHVQHIEWVKNNGLLVTSFVAAGSLIAFLGALYLRKMNGKGMLLQIIGLIIAAMILLMNVHPLMATIIVVVQLLLILVTVINRSKLN